MIEKICIAESVMVLKLRFFCSCKLAREKNESQNKQVISGNKSQKQPC